MNQRLINKQIIVAVTGGIAAYKSADLVRRLRESGAEVRVVMTAHAKEFITPLTMQAVSGHPVHDDLFDPQAEAGMGHIELARWADVLLVAPATADCMARILHGQAPDLLTTLCLATKAPLVLVPAMNQGMWKHTATQSNICELKTRGALILGPGSGSQACGDVGMGRMIEPIEIVEEIVGLFQSGQWSGKKILITSGPTHEAIDPIRFITNASSGKMGHALAEACFEAGADVTLISGPVNIPFPGRVKVVSVVSAEDMYHAVMARVAECDVFFSVAAVGDYRAKEVAAQKIAKKNETMVLELVRNRDIVAQVAALEKRPFVVGFAAETENMAQKALAKKITKKLDVIVGNPVGNKQGMGSDDNTVTVFWQDRQMTFETMSKTKLARELVELIGKIITKGPSIE